MHNRTAVMVVVATVVAFSILFVGSVAAQEAPDCSTVSYDTDGDGALLIEDVDQLQCMGEDLTADYRLDNDIDASETADWNEGDGFEPVGDDDTPFEGSLDGDGHKVTNLIIDRSEESWVGIFASTDRAVIESVGIEGAEITAFDYVGGFAGEANDTRIYDSYLTGNISATNCCVGGLAGFTTMGGEFDDVYTDVHLLSENCCSGGFFGWTEGDVSITDSHVEGEIVDENCCTGGMAGWFGGSTNVTNSYSTADVDSAFCCSGGLAGWTQENVHVKASYATGDVTDGNCCTGGLFGWIQGNTVVEDSYATGNVTGESCCIGGFTGGVWGGDSVIRDSYATGDVDGTGGYIGGFFGDSSGERVVRSTATGDVNGTGDHVGGFGGYVAIEVTESNAMGNVTSEDDRVGGFAGEVTFAGVVDRSYARGDVTGNDVVGGFVGLNEGTVDESYSVGTPTATTAEGASVGGFAASSVQPMSLSTRDTKPPVTVEKEDGNSLPPIETPPTRENDDASIESSSVGVLNEELTNSYWDEEASGTSESDGGTPLTTDEMTGDAALESMLGFDFEEIWLAVENDYPILSNQPEIVEEEEVDEFLQRRDIGRADMDRMPPTDRELRRGETRQELDDRTNRESNTQRRDRSRDDNGR